MTRPKKRAPLGLVQAWVPKRVKAWAERNARARGLSLAAWLRSNLIEQMDATP